MKNYLNFWKRSEKDVGRTVRNKLLASQTLKVANELQIPDFKAPDRFISNWKHRFDVSMHKGTNDSQKMPEQFTEKISAFHRSIKKL